MANVSPDLLQFALRTLLQGREPSSMAPVPIAPADQIGPLDMETTAALAALQPQPVPPALPGPVDADAIRSRFAGLAGPEPVAPPPPEPASLIIRIARALQGYGAGFQGQGVQFLESLQAQKEAPQKEFRARKERFETRRQELGVMAEQAVSGAEERRQARTAELLDRQSERDFQASVKKAGLKSQEAIVRMKEAFDLERDAKKAEAERLERERKDAKERKDRVDNIAKELFDDLKISRQQARAFAEFEVNQTPLSKADAKVYSRLEKYRRPAGGTGAGSPMVEVVDPQGNVVLGPLPYGSVKFDNGLVSGFPGASIRRAQGGGQSQNFPLQPGGSPEFSGLPPGVGAYTPQAAPKLNNQQRARFNDIKRERPDLTDEQVQTYMRTKGWLK